MNIFFKYIRNKTKFNITHFSYLFSIYLLLSCNGCSNNFPIVLRESPKDYYEVKMLCTAYCACQKCCGWKYNKQGYPIFASGKNRGKRKIIGICADGSKVHKGTLAADTRYYPFKCKMYIPGYGWGVVHDRGGGIKGRNHIDLFFPTHQQALNWGRRTVTVRIYK